MRLFIQVHIYTIVLEHTFTALMENKVRQFRNQWIALSQ